MIHNLMLYDDKALLLAETRRRRMAESKSKFFGTPKNLFADSDRSHAEVSGFLIKDNGIGFDDQNFEAFSTSDTIYKASRGGKGIGRFMLLAAFERAEIESGFRANGHMKVRRLTFCTRGTGIESAICIEAADQDRTTTIKLLGFLVMEMPRAGLWLLALDG